uniref:NADH-ubiquinone oxidoreductase chain 6 n=1 Tax=Potamanthellus edmundsi TaxID=2680887 RepID=A0A8K1RC88_9INSE|nr:NADH dehydrogenase subunit 6 [Potamanthellus edmundsi]
MSLYLFIGLTSIVGLMFCFMTHPLAMGLILLLQTTLTAITSGLMAPSFWFSYILFLVFLGGMLVLFIYVTSLASNEMFSFSPKMIIFSYIFMTTMFLFFFLMDPSLFNYFLTILNDNNNLLMHDNMIWTLTLKLYSSTSYIITSILIFYLFLTLIAVVNITQIQEGPLRTFN